MKSGGATGMAGTDTASPPTARGSAREPGGDEVGHRLSGLQGPDNAISYVTEGDNKNPATVRRYCCVCGRSVVSAARDCGAISLMVPVDVKHHVYLLTY